MTGFDDLDGALEEQEREDDDGGDATPAFEDLDVEGIDIDDGDEQLTDPAFAFDDAIQDPLYARQSSWDTIDDALDLDLEGEMRERGIRDVPKREKHDALLLVAARHVEEIADQIEEERTGG